MRTDEISLYKRVTGLIKTVWLRYKSLPILGKLVIWGIVSFDTALLVIIAVVGPSKITQKLYDFGQDLANYRFGWMILGAIMIIISFPPLIFYSTTVSLCGFTYGLKGFFLAGPAALLGSAIVFVLLRFAFRKRLRTWTSNNEKWQALEAVIKAKGLPLIILIRMSPFPPWVYSNACFASIEAVSLWQFLVATLFVMPKLFLVVFVGSRIAKLSDGEQRGQMDIIAKVLNIVSVVVSIALGILAGAVTYRLLQKQIKELRESADLNGELAVDALEETEEGAPLLQNTSSESMDIENL
ncbi:Golgi apparatus membrane protein TVP38 [Phellopilus nigrolimitatus]|nr:Golgi apparatus membrane protein TVP38 [Phellopilus nigrolimitatus]